MARTRRSRPLEDGWIRDWLLLGPRQDKLGEASPLLCPEHMPGLLRWGGERHPDGWPREGEEVPPDGKKWRFRESREKLVRADAGGPGRHARWIYAATYLRAYGNFAGRLELRCRGSYVLRAASRPLLSHFGWPRPLEKPPEETDLRLPDGGHLLLLKLVSYGEPFAFGVRLRDAEGEPLEGTRPVAVRTEPLQSMRLNLPPRGRRHDAPTKRPWLCGCAHVENEVSPSVEAPEWGCGMPADRFRTADGKLERGGTVVHAGYDDSTLYVLLRCRNPRPRGAGEPEPWLVDHGVIMLDPGHTHRKVSAFLVNRRGELWSPNADCADVGCEMQRAGDTWAALLRIPFQVLGCEAAPQVGFRWGVNALRVCPAMSDGPAFWTRIAPHGELLVAPDVDGGSPLELYGSPELWGHLEFGPADVRVQSVGVRMSAAGRPELRLEVENRGGRGRLYAEAEAVGTADSWPITMDEPESCGQASADRMLKQGSTVRMTLPLGDLPPGRYGAVYTLNVPGRRFQQDGEIPFRAPRTLEIVPASCGDSSGEDEEGRFEATVSVADPLPSGLLVSTEVSAEPEEVRLAWNGEEVEQNRVCGRRILSHIPASAARRGDNMVVWRSDAAIERARVRLHDEIYRDPERGRMTYVIFPGEADPGGIEVRTGAVGKGEARYRSLRLLPAGRWNLPLLLDRPGGTVASVRGGSQVRLRVFREVPGRGAPEVCFNGDDLDPANQEPGPAVLDGEAVELVDYRFPVPAALPENGLNSVGLTLDDGLFLMRALFVETRLDDPGVSEVPVTAASGESFTVELFTGTPARLQDADTPRGIEPEFQVPRDVPTGRTRLEYRNVVPAPSGRASLTVDEERCCFDLPRILPARTHRQRETEKPSFRLSAGPLALQLAAARGRALSCGAEEFSVHVRPDALPYCAERGTEKFRRTFRNMAFLAGAEPHGAEEQALPDVYRRDGLPRSHTAVLAGGTGDNLTSGWWYRHPGVCAVFRALCDGEPFPGRGAPIMPRTGTGHFHGTPLGGFDVLSSDCSPNVLSRYRLLVVTREHGVDPDAVEELVRDEGARLLLTSEAESLMEQFDIQLEGSHTSGAARFTDRHSYGISGAASERSPVTYRKAASPPDDALVVAGPNDDALCGTWHRGRGEVSVFTGERPGEHTELLGRCVRRLVDRMPPLFRCSDNRVAFTVFPEDEEEWTLFCRGDGTHGRIPPARIYVADMECPPAAQAKECGLEVAGRELPLQLSPGKVQGVFAAEQLLLNSPPGSFYFEEVAPRTNGYEVLVRGRGRGHVTALPLTGAVSGVRAEGQELDWELCREGADAVTFELEATPFSRFQINIDRSEAGRTP